jgi:hypothetical protein
MDDQRFKQRTTIGLIVLGALAVIGGVLAPDAWWAGALRLIGG